MGFTYVMRLFVTLSSSTARIIFAASLAGLGVVHAVFGEAVTRMFPTWPAALPGRPWWAHGAGVLLIIFGSMTLLRKRARMAAALIGIVILLSVACLHLPRSIQSGNFGDEWLNVLKWLAMASGAFLVSADFPETSGGSFIDGLTKFFAAGAKWFLGAFMIGAAILHIRYAQFVALFIPEWIPWRIFWTKFTAVTLTAGGIGLVIPATARLAAFLTSLMIFLWFLLVHIPHTIADPLHNPGWCEMFESLAFAAMALLLAEKALASVFHSSPSAASTTAARPARH